MVFKLIDIVFKNIKKELTQNDIKETIFELVSGHPPPRKGKKLLKIYDVMVNNNNNIKEIFITVMIKIF